MVKFSVTFCALAASCDKAEPSQSFESFNDNAQAVLALTVTDSHYTKASGVNPLEEKRINDVQVFIFTSDGTLDAYESAQGTTLQVRCTSGPKRMYVFANAPSLAAYSAESALKSAVTRLSDNYAGAFVMVSGLKEVNVSAGNNSMPVVVSRVAARVEVAKITNAMSSAQHQGKTFKGYRKNRRPQDLSGQNLYRHRCRLYNGKGCCYGRGRSASYLTLSPQQRKPRTYNKDLSGGALRRKARY